MHREEDLAKEMVAHEMQMEEEAPWRDAVADITESTSTALPACGHHLCCSTSALVGGSAKDGSARNMVPVSFDCDSMIL
jgi:hypothetical protein